MEYFWRQQDDIPQGLGYQLFGTTHFISVILTLAGVFLLVRIFSKLENERQERWLKAITLIMLSMELFKDGFLLSVNRFGLGYLPLHICSIGILIFLLNEFLPWRKAGEILGEIAFIVIMPASFSALLFADWTIYYPVWNFMNLYSYIWHGLLMLYPVLKAMRGEIITDIKHIHYVILFFCVVIPPVYIFDKCFDCNYFFINWPVPNTPLAWFAARMGNPGYLLGYAGLTAGVILLEYSVIHILRR